MGQRQEPRVKVDLSVRVFGLDSRGNAFSQNAKVEEVSPGGARLKDLGCVHTVGETLTVKNGSRTARFKVAWIGDFGAVGLESVDADQRFWGVTFGPPEKDTFKTQAELAAAATAQVTVMSTSATAKPSPAATRGERRRAPRFRCHGSAQFQPEHVGFKTWATVTDLSKLGCYFELSYTIARDTNIHAVITVGETAFETEARVATSDPGVGVGVEFTSMSAADRQKLDSLISKLESSRK